MVLEIWYVCFDFMEKIAKQIEFALSCTYSVFTYFSVADVFLAFLQTGQRSLFGKDFFTVSQKFCDTNEV